MLNLNLNLNFYCKYNSSAIDLMISMSSFVALVLSFFQIKLIRTSFLALSSNYTEQYRPQFHYTPPENWMNDPNGLIFHGGLYHLFFQYNPYSIDCTNISWGHAVSEDLIHWDTKPPAMVEENDQMIFSGSAILDEGNVSGLVQPGPIAPILLYYTGYQEDTLLQDQNVAFCVDSCITNNPIPFVLIFLKAALSSTNTQKIRS